MVLFPRNAQQRKRTILLTALGVASAVIYLFVDWSDRRFKLDLPDFPFFPGLILGITLALYLFFARQVHPLRGLGLIIASMASWNFAVWLSVELYFDLTGFSFPLEIFISSLLGGFIWWGLLVISLSGLFGFFQSARLRAFTVAVGAVLVSSLIILPLILHFPNADWLLFPVWQGAFAYCFSLALIEADEKHGLPKSDM